MRTNRCTSDANGLHPVHTIAADEGQVVAPSRPQFRTELDTSPRTFDRAGRRERSDRCDAHRLRRRLPAAVRAKLRVSVLPEGRNSRKMEEEGRGEGADMSVTDEQLQVDPEL